MAKRQKKAIKKESPQRRRYEEAFRLLAADVVAPLYKERLLSGELDIVGAFEEFFGTDHREIYHIVFRRECTLVGKRWVEGRGVSKRYAKKTWVKKGTVGLLRFDTRQPNLFEFELGTDRAETRIRALTFKQFHEIKKYIDIHFYSHMSGKNQTHARRFKKYHEDFVSRHFGLQLKWYTVTGKSRPEFKEASSDGPGDGVRGKDVPGSGGPQQV